LWLGQQEVMALLDDCSIPFDNDQAEHYLSTPNVQQQFAGPFRADSESGHVPRIRGYGASLRTPGVARLDALEPVLLRPPLSPAVD
jgi:hypothetical protein